MPWWSMSAAPPAISASAAPACRARPLPSPPSAACGARLGDVGDRSRVASLPKSLINAALVDAQRELEGDIDRMKTEAGDVPLLAVGGGAFVVPDRLPGIS